MLFLISLQVKEYFITYFYMYMYLHISFKQIKMINVKKPQCEETEMMKLKFRVTD